ncbi:MAG: VPLPA-CTERM sorting domain-containing protein [Parvularculaceae bacterium]
MLARHGRLAPVLFTTLFGCVFSTSQVFAKGRVSDGGNVDACTVQTADDPMPANGALQVAIGVYDSGTFNAARGGNCAPATLSPFSINVGGTSYDKLFVHENGVITFGAPTSAAPGTALSSFSVPIFAPFFADAATPDLSSLRFGYTSLDIFPNVESFWLTWSNFVSADSPASPSSIFQLGIVPVGTSGDFDLIFNYETIRWDSPTIGAQAGVNDGQGNSIVLPGAGVPGKYLGEISFSSGSPVCLNANDLATALACNAINDGSQIGGTDDPNGNSLGYYLFQFRNGVLLTNGAEVPLPAAAWLFVLGAGALGARKLRRR